MHSRTILTRTRRASERQGRGCCKYLNCMGVCASFAAPARMAACVVMRLAYRPCNYAQSYPHGAVGNCRWRLQKNDLALRLRIAMRIQKTTNCLPLARHRASAARSRADRARSSSRVRRLHSRCSITGLPDGLDAGAGAVVRIALARRRRAHGVAVEVVDRQRGSARAPAHIDEVISLPPLPQDLLDLQRFVAGLLPRADRPGDCASAAAAERSRKWRAAARARDYRTDGQRPRSAPGLVSQRAGAPGADAHWNAGGLGAPTLRDGPAGIARRALGTGRRVRTTGRAQSPACPRWRSGPAFNVRAG